MCDWLSLSYGYDTITINKVDGCGLSITNMPGKEDEVDTVLVIEKGLNYLAVPIRQSASVIKVRG